jgi:hypothetical protein
VKLAEADLVPKDTNLRGEYASSRVYPEWGFQARFFDSRGVLRMQVPNS